MATLVAVKAADIQIPKLTGTNYCVWSELIIEALEGRGVWGYTQELIKEPTDESEKAIWRQNNVVAVGIIKGALLES